MPIENKKNGDVVYGPLKLTVSNFIIWACFFLVGVTLVVIGWKEYSKLSHAQSVFWSHPVQSIMIGGMCAGFSAFSYVLRLAGRRRNLPRLTLNSRGFVYQSFWNRVVSADWSAVGPFMVTSSSRGQKQNIEAALIGSPLNEERKKHACISFPGHAFVKNLHALSIEMNRRRSRAIGEEFLTLGTHCPRPETFMTRLLKMAIAVIVWLTLSVVLIAGGTAVRVFMGWAHLPYNLVLFPSSALLSGFVVFRRSRRKRLPQNEK